MKTCSQAFSFGFVLVLLTTAFAQSAPPVSLTIEARRPEIRVGSAVEVNLTFTNNSDRNVDFRLTNPLCNYSTEVRESTGNLVPDTKLKSTADCDEKTAKTRNIGVWLGPNESRQDTVAVSAFSDMSQPGEYSVQVMWRAPKELGGDLVKSNKIIVSVTD